VLYVRLEGQKEDHMPPLPEETPGRNRGEKPTKEQKPDNEGGEAENEADKAVREAHEKAEAEKAGDLSAAQIAAAVVSTGLLPH
jgi:hypothetical protein